MCFFWRSLLPGSINCTGIANPSSMRSGQERILFAVLSTYLIASLNKRKTIDEMIEISRMYSAEVEYSSENTGILFEILRGD
jgi:hypothetical protein